MACNAAVKAGDSLSSEQITQLITDFNKTEKSLSSLKIERSNTLTPNLNSINKISSNKFLTNHFRDYSKIYNKEK